MAYKKVMRNVGRKIYKASGYKNPMKKGKLSSSRVVKQVPKLIKDVSRIYGMLNTEKKRVIQTNTVVNTMGQINGNGSGHWLLDVTPNPGQGVGYDQKTGNQIKLVSSHFDMQFIGQSAMISGMKLKVEIIQVIGQPFSTVSDIMGRYIVPTKFIRTSVGGASANVYDINSDRDQDYFTNYRVLRRVYVTLKQDDLSGEQVSKRVSFGIKYKNFHIRNNDNDPTLSRGQILMLITADKGNCSTATTSTLVGVPIQAFNTGALLDYEFIHYFVDN